MMMGLEDRDFGLRDWAAGFSPKPVRIPVVWAMGPSKYLRRMDILIDETGSKWCVALRALVNGLRIRQGPK